MNRRGSGPTLRVAATQSCTREIVSLKKVETLEKNFPGKIEGRLWLDNINEWLLVSDVLFSKPGPGICAEALMSDTVIFLNALESIMPQEVSVYEKLLCNNWGFGIETAADFNNALQDWLDSQSRYREIQNNVQNQHIQDGCEEFCQQVLENLIIEERAHV